MHEHASLKLARACWLWGDDEVRNSSGRGGNPVTRSSQDPPATLQEGCTYYRGARVASPIKKIYGGHRAATKIDSARLPQKKPLANRREAYGLYESCSALLAHGRRHVGFTSLLLQILELLLRIVELLLLVRDLLLKLRVFFIP